MPIWNKERECISRSALEALQLEGLQQTVSRAYRNVPYYRRLLDESGCTPASIKTLDDLRRLPFTTKDALRDNYPFGLFALPMDSITRLHASSGTTGKPIVVGYSRQDLETWSELIARVVSLAGVTEKDIAQICFNYGLFTGGFGLHYGLEKVGATVVPASSGNTRRQIMLMQDFQTTALISTPSYALHILEVAEEMGVARDRLKLRVGLFGGEPWSESMRCQIENRLGIRATDNYGLSEVMGPGVAGECLEGQGMHISEDHFLVEIIDPRTEEVLPYGSCGEMVITTLSKEALPIIRYRTRDLTVIDPSPCPCGRTLARMQKVTGRTDDMLVISGVNVFPSQIESVLMEIQGVAPHYQIVIDKQGYLDVMEVQVELERDYFTGSFRDLELLEEKIREHLAVSLSIRPRVKLLEPRSLERTVGKAQRVVDRRQQR